MAIDWGILKSPSEPVIRAPVAIGPTEGLMKGLEAGRLAKEQQSMEKVRVSEALLRGAQTEETKGRTAIQQEELKTLPQKLQLDIQKQKQGLGTGAIEQRMKLQDLSDTKLKSEISKMSVINHAFGGLQNLAPEDRASAFNIMVPDLAKRGIDTTGIPKRYEDDPRAAEIAIKKAFAVSDFGLKKFEGEEKFREVTAAANIKAQGEIDKEKAKIQFGAASAREEAYGKEAWKSFAAMQTSANNAVLMLPT